MSPQIRMNKYKAFISYSHASNNTLAATLQYKLERFSKKWYQVRAFKLFRDTTHLSTGTNLWGEIETALSHSDYFIYLASKQAAQSPWVCKEIQWWLENRTMDNFIIVWVDDVVLWQDQGQRQRGDFDWQHTDALPTLLTGVFHQEPLYPDLRNVTKQLNSPDCENKIASICATLLAKSKDEIYGDFIVENKKKNQAIVVSFATLSLLLVVAIGASIQFFNQRNESQRLQLLAEQRLTIAHKQAKNTLGVLWVYLLYSDYADNNQLDRQQQLNKLLEIMDDNDPQRIQKAIDVVTEFMRLKGIATIDEDQYTLSKFETLYTTIFSRKNKFPAMELLADADVLFWTWSDKQLKSFELLLKVLINPDSPDTFGRYGKLLTGSIKQQFDYLYDLVRFASEPTLQNLTALSKHQYYFDTSELSKSLDLTFGPGFEVISSFHKMFIYTMYSTKTGLNEPQKQQVLTNLLNRISKVTDALYQHSKDNSQYTQAQKEKIKGAYYYGVIKLQSNRYRVKTIDERLPAFMLIKADDLLAASKWSEAMVIYNKILTIAPHSYKVNLRKVIVAMLQQNAPLVQQVLTTMHQLFPEQQRQIKHLHLLANTLPIDITIKPLSDTHKTLLLALLDIATNSKHDK